MKLTQILNEFENVVHDRPAIQVGSAQDGDHVSEDGFAYRTISPRELQDAKDHGFLRANPNGKSAGGRQDVKHWDRGGGGRYFRSYNLKNGGQLLIRTPISKVQTNQPVSVQDLQLVDPDTWKASRVV